MTVKLLDHVNIHTADLAGTVDFYVDVIGLEQGERPTTIGRPGAWLYCGGRPLIHLNENEQSRPGGTGPIDHVAFQRDQSRRDAGARARGRGGASSARRICPALPAQTRDGERTRQPGERYGHAGCTQ